MPAAYPEVHVKVPCTAKFPIPNLECDRHLVIFVQLLVEAFSRVGLELDIVCQRGSKECGGRNEKGGCEAHGDGQACLYAVCTWDYLLLYGNLWDTNFSDR